uniref:Uncharacterized protein n=1 Tax=viral metagenome TaxID=1070528 RepID=A0A6M3KPS5_9ZZZZ
MLNAVFTENGAPKDGLTNAVIYIYDLSDNSLIVNGAAVTAVAKGGYKYNFTTYNGGKDYYIVWDSVDLTGHERYAYANIRNVSDYKADVSALAVEANVEGHVTTSLNSYDPPTRAEATADKAAIIVEIDANEIKIDRLLGLTNENTYIDTTVFDSNGNLSSARLRTYSVAGSVGTVSDVLATYIITAVGVGKGKFSSWKQVKQ